MPERKKKAPMEMPGLPGWMATYSDMVTLLLTFFVMLLAMANFDDVKRMEDVMESVRKSLGVMGWTKQALKTQDGESKSENFRVEDTVHPTVARIRQAMQKHISNEMVRITQRQHEIRLKLDSRLFFKPASAELNPTSYGILADLAKIMKAEEGMQIKVEGHTDASGSEERNWDLSAQRAVAVVEVLRSKGPVPGNRLAAVGMGSFRPESEYEADSPWNRRVEIVMRADHITVGGMQKLMEVAGDK
jgi:chemotaxis protein MotB